MRSQVRVTNGTTTSKLAVFDNYLTPFNVSVAVIPSTTIGLAYTVQHTFDDVTTTAYNPSTGNWFPNDNSNLVNASSSQTGNYAFPVSAARIITTGTGTISATFTQAGLRG